MSSNKTDEKMTEICASKEVLYIYYNTRGIPEKTIARVLDYYYDHCVDSNPDPETHYDSIHKILGVSQEDIKRIFEMQLCYLRSKFCRVKALHKL